MPALDPASTSVMFTIVISSLALLTASLCTTGKSTLEAWNKFLQDRHNRDVEKTKAITQRPSAYSFKCGNCKNHKLEFRHPQQMRHMMGTSLVGNDKDWENLPICDECIDTLSTEKLKHERHES